MGTKALDVLTIRARALRQRETLAEARLWVLLRGSQLQHAKFRRQHVIGRHIVDFCSRTHKLVIELDGAAHRGRLETDRLRDAELAMLGFRVLRFWNGRVEKRPGDVVARITRTIAEGVPAQRRKV